MQVLNEMFTYDPETGNLFWKERPKHHFPNIKGWISFNSKFAGQIAGYRETRRGTPVRISVRVKMNRTTHLFGAHRIIYHIMGLVIPDGLEIDHKDTNPYNNRWDNLRLATRAQNAANLKKHRTRKHMHLPKGVSTKRKKFRSQIGFRGKPINLGSFDTPEEAHAAYTAKAKELYGEFARSG